MKDKMKRSFKIPDLMRKIRPQMTDIRIWIKRVGGTCSTHEINH